MKKLIEKYETIAEAASPIPSRRQFIRKCCQGKLRSFNGFIWKFA